MTANRLPSLLGLRAFEAAARRLSFTEAALELHVSQAAVSRHVRALEQELGRPLFRRLHRRVELTVPGQRLATELGAGFSQIHRAVDAVRGNATQSLRVSVEPGFAARWLVPRLGGFTAANPRVELELDATDILRTVGRDTDVAIRFLSLGARPRGKARRLFAFSGFPVACTPNGGVRQSRDAAVEEYRLLHDDDGTAWRNWFAAAGLAGYEQAKHLHLNDSSLVLTAAMRGQGVALSAPIYVGSDWMAGQLMRVGQTVVTFGAYWLLEADDRPTAKARRVFIEWLNRELAPFV
jgi:LysR family transcriptional regulator, glycine cleavage system transcriptional activator